MGTFSKKVAAQAKDYPFKARVYNYDLYSADFADIFGTSNANNVVTETGKVTIADTIVPTINFDEDGPNHYATAWECGYPAFNYRSTKKAKQYTDCFDDTFTHGLVANQGQPSAAQRTCLGLGAEKADYSTATGIGKGTAHANAAGAYTAGDESHITGHTNWNSVELTYNLKDTFDNAAAEKKRTITITDTIAPTLYITQSSI